MRFLILMSILFWGSIIANYAQDLPPDIQNIEDIKTNDELSEDNISILPAIDHQQFDATYPDNDTGTYTYTYKDKFKIQSNFSAPTQKIATNDIPFVIKKQHDPYRADGGVGLGIHYLGILTKIGIEKSLFQQMSLGLYYGRFLGHYYGTNKKGLIPGLDHYSLEFNIYVNSHKKAFSSGPIVKFGAHYNHLKNRPNAQQIEVNGQKVIGRGEHKWGPLIGAAYFWQGPYVNLTIGAEYFVLGKLKSFVPLSLGLGIAF